MSTRQKRIRSVRPFDLRQQLYRLIINFLAMADATEKEKAAKAEKVAAAKKRVSESSHAAQANPSGCADSELLV